MRENVPFPRIPYVRDLFESELFVESFDAPAGIDELLLAGKERVAVRADLDLYVLLCRTGIYDRTTAAPDGRLVVFGM
jgi:hypothetical protein